MVLQVVKYGRLVYVRQIGHVGIFPTSSSSRLATSVAAVVVVVIVGYAGRKFGVIVIVERYSKNCTVLDN